MLLSNKGAMGTNAPVYRVHDILLKILAGERYELPQVPIGMKMRSLIEAEGIESARARYRDLRRTAEKTYDFSESELNALGYHYLSKEMYDEARAVFGLNVETYPRSANVYDSYGEACLLAGDDQEAIRNYNRSVELDPANTNAAEMLERLRDRN